MLFRFRHRSAAEVLLLQVQAPKVELLGPKSQNRTVQSCKSEGPGQSILCGRCGLAGELWNLLGNCLDPATLQVKAEVKGYLRDKSYD